MSRRERDDRESDSRRRRSGFDRQANPKRSRRERVSSSANLDVEDHTGRDQKHRRRLQDALPLEAPKVESGALSKESEKKPNGHHEESKHFSYFQHDERGNAAQVGRSFGRRAATDPRRRDSKDDRDERAADKSSTYDSRQRDDKSQPKGDKNVWRHDGFFEIETEPAPPVRKRPAFREKKISVDPENAEAAAEPTRPGHSDRPTSASERREERDRKPRHSDRLEEPVLGDKKEAQSSALPSRDRYNNDGSARDNYRGRERFSGRQGYRPSGIRVEKWKHDLFDEANRSPTSKNEEDQIAKVEELLAS